MGIARRLSALNPAFQIRLVARRAHVGPPAYVADIVRGDIIDTFDGRPVDDSRDLLSKILDAAGKTVTVEIQRLGNVATLREGSRKTVTVKLNELPAPKKPASGGH